MKKLLKKSISTVLALMVCLGFWGSNSIEADAASYNKVKVILDINSKQDAYNNIKLSVCKDAKGNGASGHKTIKNLFKGRKSIDLNGSSWSSKNNCYIRVEYNSTISGKQVKYIKVTPKNFKNYSTKTIKVNKFNNLSV